MHNKVEYELFLSNEDLESGDGLIGKYVVNIGFLFNRLQGKGNQAIAINKKFLLQIALHNEILFSMFLITLKKN